MTAVPWIILGELILLGAPVALVDVRTHRIPNRGMVVGAILGVIEQGIWGHLEGSLAGGATALSLTLIARRMTHGLGLGDVKYFGVVGLALGPIGALAVLGLASGCAVVEGLVRLGLGHGTLRDRRPLGPWIALASVIVAASGVVGWHRF